MIRRKSTLFEQGLNCIVMLVVGIVTAPVFPYPLQHRLLPFAILGLPLVCLADSWYRSKENIKRAQKDERNQMILDKAVWYCYQVEDWILIGLIAVFGVCFEQYELSQLLLWILVGRSVLTFCVRWWLSRKY
ncbi:MAG: hypothetical protein HFF56_00045 [Lawsonibacter sp.]|nr:hypothetical protein [Lawsonibacter sp.]